jgi:ribosomal protein S18 acetylase RimI-like enzyme
VYQLAHFVAGRFVSCAFVVFASQEYSAAHNLKLLLRLTLGKSSMEIISVVEKNWEELKAIRLASLKDSPEAFSASYKTALNFDASQWKIRASGKDGYKFFIAKNCGQLVGIVGGFYKTGEYELISMWVSPNQRNNGIAKVLVNAVIQHAKELEKDVIFLEVLSSNLPACRLYKE